jgi:hypothetical protein
MSRQLLFFIQLEKRKNYAWKDCWWRTIALYQCLEYDANSQKYFLSRSYLDETPEINPSWKGVEIVLQPRKLSTCINAISDAGLIIERLIESEVNMGLTREQDYAPENWYSVPRAQWIPTTFIIKASKPS